MKKKINNIIPFGFFSHPNWYFTMLPPIPIFTSLILL